MLGRAGWEVPALSGHEFRQAQTALSIRSMQDTGFRLDYETPVLGKPWSIPMEFPLYQYLVSQWAESTGDPIAQSGRWVSSLAFLGGILAGFPLLRLAGLSRGASGLLLSMVVLSPIYIFYSRTVLIEPLAWMLSAWFLVGVLKFRTEGNGWFFALAWVMGALAVLVKSTTWAGFCLPWAIIFIRDVWVHRTKLRSKAKCLAMESLGLGVPLLLLGYSWVAYADHVKSQNPIGRFLVSDQLTEFNFGTLAMRLDPEFWNTMYSHWVTSIAVWPVLLVGLGISLGWKSSRRLMGIGIAAFLGIQLIFSGLYLYHDYYFYANGAFLLIAVGAGLSAWWDQAAVSWRALCSRCIVIVLLAIALNAQFYRYYETYRGTQTAQAVAGTGLTQAIRAITQPDEVVAAHSGDWNSTLALYAERRMLIIPDSEMYFHPDRVKESVALLADESVPLFLMIGRSRENPRWIAQRIAELDLISVPLFEWAGQVTAFARVDRYAEMKQILEENTFDAIIVDSSQALLPVAQRQDMTGPEEREKLAPLGLEPIAGILPYGLHVGDTSMLMHAVSELYFVIPDDATEVEIAYSVIQDSYSQHDFDGMSMSVDFVDENQVATPWHFDWFSPEDGWSERNFVLRLPRKRPSQLVVRALPGPAGRNAYDQGQLHYLRFRSDRAQTTDAK